MIVIIDPDARFRKRLAEMLGEGAESVSGGKDLERWLTTRRDEVDALVVGPNAGTPVALGLAQRVQRDAPEIGVVMIESTLSSEVLQGALRAGVRDVLPANVDAKTLVQAVTRAQAVGRALRKHDGSRATEAGRIITVFSPKGGVGKSMVATNLAVLLAQRGKRVVAADLDLQFGDLAIMLQMFPARTIYDAANHAGDLEAETLLDYCSPHRSGVLLMPAPLEPGLAENVAADRAQEMLTTLRAGGLTVVVDTPPWFTDHVLQALDVSDDMVLVATMDVPSIKNLKVGLQTLEMLGYPRDRLRVVLNRADSKVGLSVADVERALGTGVDVAIPSSREVPLSVNRGQPLALSDARSPVVQALAKLATLVVDAPAPAATPAASRKPRFGRRVR